MTSPYEIGIFISSPMISPFSFVSTSDLALSSASAISALEIPSAASSPPCEAVPEDLEAVDSESC
jgi:hypothetical protein